MTDKVEISIQPAQVALLAGDTVEVTANVRNLGQTIDQLTIGVDGLDTDWYTLPVSSVALFPNDQDELRIILHPPKAAESKPGTFPFRIAVTSQENPGTVATADVTIEIKPLLELELEVSPERIAGRRATYQVILTNPGHRDITVNLDACDARGRLRYRLDPESLTAAGASKSSATLEVRLGCLSFFGREKEFDFQVGAAPPQEEGEVAHVFCPYCGHRLQKEHEAAPDLFSRYSGRLQGAYERAYDVVCRYSQRYRKGYGGIAVFCACCSRKLRDDAVTANAQFVRTPWLKERPRIRLRRIRLRRIRCPRIRFPSLSRQPVIDTFRATSDDKREFKLTWSVKRAREVRLDSDDVAAKGEMMVRPGETITYTLTAVNRRKSASQTVEVRPLPLPEAKTSDRIKASLSLTEIQAHAGGVPVEATLEVQNLGEIVDKFLVEMEGVNEAWCIRSASSVALMPQATDQVRLSFQPPKKEGVRDGQYPFAVSVRSQSAPEEVTTIVGQLEVLPSPEFKSDIRPKRISCRRKGTFRINLANTGVSDINFELQASEMEEGCKFRFKTENLKVRAWNAAEVPMLTRPKRWCMVGEEKRYNITLTATAAGGDTQSLNCELHHRPFFKSWKSVLRWVRRIIILVGLILLIYFVIKWGGGWGQLTSSPRVWWNQLVSTFRGWF